MKNSYIIAGVIVLIAALGIFWGSRKSEAPLSQQSESLTTLSKQSDFKEGMYRVIESESNVKLQADYMNGEVAANLTFPVTSGSFSVSDGTIQDGEFSVNLPSNILGGSIESGTDNNQGEYHTATFTLKTIAPTSDTGLSEGRYVVAGDLSINNISVPISLVAAIHQEGERVIVDGSFALNRTEWGINYNSPTYFPELNEKAVRDAVLITLDLQAQKVIQ